MLLDAFDIELYHLQVPKRTQQHQHMICSMKTFIQKQNSVNIGDVTQNVTQKALKMK